LAPFPGIPAGAPAAAGDPDPLDLGLLREALLPLADPPEAPLARLVDYGRLLLAANTRTNLTGARTWERLLPGHLLDSVRAAAFVPDDARFLADWGSGPGLPGIVWAILFPEKRILLVERNGKKAAFLREALLRLELFQAEVLHGAGEEHRKAFDPAGLLVARAVEKPARLLERLRRHRIPHALLFLMLGPGGESEWRALSEGAGKAWALSALHRYELGPGQGIRTLAVLHPRRGRRADPGK